MISKNNYIDKYRINLNYHHKNQSLNSKKVHIKKWRMKMISKLINKNILSIISITTLKANNWYFVRLSKKFKGLKW